MRMIRKIKVTGFKSFIIQHLCLDPAIKTAKSQGSILKLCSSCFAVDWLLPKTQMKRVLREKTSLITKWMCTRGRKFFSQRLWNYAKNNARRNAKGGSWVFGIYLQDMALTVRSLDAVLSSSRQPLRTIASAVVSEGSKNTLESS